VDLFSYTLKWTLFPSGRYFHGPFFQPWTFFPWPFFRGPFFRTPVRGHVSGRAMPLEIGLWSKRLQTKTVKSKTATRNGCRLVATVWGFQAVISRIDCFCIELYYFCHPTLCSAVYAIVVGRPKICPKIPKWRTAAILKKDKLLYLSNGSTDFFNSLHADAHCP